MTPAAFLAVATRPGDSGASNALAADLLRQDWRLSRQSADIELWTRGEPTIANCPFGKGWIVGDVFARRGELREPAGDRARLTPFVAARCLAGSAFGAYVALWPQPGGLAVFRDPSGVMDVQIGCWEGMAFASSELSTPGLDRLLTGRGVKWSRLADMLRDPIEVSGGLALEGLDALAPGQLCELSATNPRVTTVWSPGAVAREAARSGEIDDPEAAGCALRDVVEQSVARSVSVADKLLVEISGGLDSAVVADAVHRCAGPSVAGWVSYLGRDPEADERAFASAVADRLGISLTVIPKLETSITAVDLAQSAAGARPCLHGLDPDYDASLRALTKATGAHSLVTGHGGDTVFWTQRTPALAEPLLTRGVRGLSDPQLRRLALWTRLSVWETLEGQPPPACRYQGARFGLQGCVGGAKAADAWMAAGPGGSPPRQEGAD